MAKSTELVRAIVSENDYLKGLCMDAGVRLADASLKEIGAPIVADPLGRNQFLNNLYNKFIASEVINRVFRNPLEVLKRDKYYPYGDTLERMIANPATAIEYANTTDNILTTVKPDFKVEYIKVNRKDKYRVSVPYPLLQQAFMSETDFNQFLSACINTLYNGDNIDEYLLMKKIISDMADANYIKKVRANPDLEEATIQIINIFDMMQLPNSNWNMYSELYPDEPLTTWCPPEDLVIVSTIDYLNHLKVKVLAAAFNLSEIELSRNIIKVDCFEGNSDIKCAILDKGFMQVHDTLYEMDGFHRADDLSEKTYLHHWQTMQSSLLANACVLVGENAQDTESGTETASAKSK